VEDFTSVPSVQEKYPDVSGEIPGKSGCSDKFPFSCTSGRKMLGLQNHLTNINTECATYGVVRFKTESVMIVHKIREVTATPGTLKYKVQYQGVFPSFSVSYLTSTFNGFVTESF